MVGKKLVVSAIYSASSNVEHAIKSLIDANINAADVSVWFSQSLTSRELDSRQPPTEPGSYLKGLGIPTSEFNRYEDFMQKSGILLSVRGTRPDREGLFNVVPALNTNEVTFGR